MDGEIKLKKDIELIIAKHCYTIGLQTEKKYRYPVHYRKNGNNYILRGYGTADVDENSFSTLQYQFGSHRMDIGKAIEEIMQLLENELEFDAYWYKTDLF